MRFDLLKWQDEVLADKSRFKIVCAGRRCGKSRLASIMLLIYGLKCPSGSGVMYIAPTQGQARVIIWDILMELGREVIVSSHVNNMEIKLVNGCTIYIRGADRPDTLRGVSLSFVVLDEYADMKPVVWEQIIRASLSDKEGDALFIGCVTKDTLILGENGIEEIGTSPIGYSDESKMVYGLGGFHKATDRYANAKSKTIKIRTKAGIELEATPNHCIFTPNGWVRMDELEIGSKTYLQYDQQVYGNNECNIDFAYFLGLYLAEGNTELKTYRVTISNGDDEIHNWLRDKFGFKRHDKFHSRKNSKEFMKKLLEWFPDAGSVRAPKKKLNSKIFGLKKPLLRKFISGYFDGDGTIASGNYNGKKRQQIACISSSKRLIEQLHTLLLNMGYRASRSEYLTLPTNKVNVSSVGYRIELNGESAYRFSREVGFMLKRKQQNAESWIEGNGHHYWFDRSDFGVLTSSDGYLKRVDKVVRKTLDRIDHKNLYDRKLLADEIESIEESENETYDFCIPDTHSYFSNGLVSHNTPKGRNHFFDLHQKGDSDSATYDSDYKSWVFYTADNELINPNEIESARRTLSSFAFKQEYLASFDNSGTDIFKEEWIKYGKEPATGSWYMACDLAGFESVGEGAKNSKKRLDQTAISIVKVTEDGKWFVKKIECGRWDVRENAVRILKNIREYKPLMVGIEKGITMNAVLPYLSDLMRKNNIFAHIHPLTHGNQNKNDRVTWALQGMFEHGRIIINEDGVNNKNSWQSSFLDEYLMFPTKNVHDDMIDSLADISQMAVTTYRTEDDDSDEYEPYDIISGI